MITEHNKEPVETISLAAIAVAEIQSLYQPAGKHVTAAEIAAIAPFYNVQQEEIGIDLALGLISPAEARNEIVWSTIYPPSGPVLNAPIQIPTMAQDIIAAELVGIGLPFHLSIG